MRLLRKLSLKTFHLHQNFSNKISYSFNQIQECAETFFLGIELTTRNPFNLKNTIQVEEIENGEIPTKLVTVGGGGRGGAGKGRKNDQITIGFPVEVANAAD